MIKGYILFAEFVEIKPSL